MPTANRICETCGKNFYASPGHIAKGWGRFCSRKCSAETLRGDKHPSWKGGLVSCTCQYCGGKFKIKPSHVAVGEGKYCSRECFKKAKSTILVCAFCNQSFSRPNTWLRGQKKYYCSRKCLDLDRAPEDNCICRECKKPFYVKPGELSSKRKRGIGSYCSMACKAKAMSKSQLTVSGVNRNTARRGGKRDDLGIYVRSSWEANYCRYLNWLVSIGEIESWQFEPDTFEFTKIRRGSRFYTPDFKIVNLDGSIEYHEIKGYMDAKSKTKLKRMAKYYPEVKLIVIDSDAYRALARDVKSFILNWE